MSDKPTFELGRVLTPLEALQLQEQSHIELMRRFEKKAQRDADNWTALYADDDDTQPPNAPPSAGEDEP